MPLQSTTMNTTLKYLFHFYTNKHFFHVYTNKYFNLNYSRSTLKVSSLQVKHYQWSSLFSIFHSFILAYFQYYMEHGEEIQLVESGKIQVFYTYFLCNCMSEKNCLKHCWGGSTVGYWTSRRSLCIVIVCRLSPPIGADRGKCGVLGIIGNGGGGLYPTNPPVEASKDPTSTVAEA